MQNIKMSADYQVVPWYNSEEWHKVYNDLSGTPTDKQEALNFLLVWKARCPSLPSGIESTLGLLQVHVQDISEETESMANEQLIRLAYSSAIMRFVNHMLDTEIAKGKSLYKAAKNMGVPDWIVDLRHETAHSNHLPSLTLLREACTTSLQWLRVNYWDKHKEYIQDYLAEEKVENIDATKVVALINFAVSISICAHSNCKIKKLSQIPSPDMRDSIFNDAQDVFGDRISLSHLNTATITSLINLTNAHFKRVLKGKDISTHMNTVLLGDDSLFLSRDLLMHFGHRNIRKTEIKLSNNYVQCFEVLLTILHKNELLLEFILSLIKISQCSENDPFKAKLSALWVSEILRALNKTKLFAQKLQKLDAQEIQLKNKDDLRQLFYHHFPNESSKLLLLDLSSPIPTELTDIQFIQPILAVYNSYLNYFVKDLLNLIQPSLPTTVAHKIYQLAELISIPEKFPLSTTSKIYTEHDLKSSEDDGCIMIVENNDEMEVVYTADPQADTSIGIWRLASSDHDWSTCPVGQLPWEQVGTEETSAQIEVENTK